MTAAQKIGEKMNKAAQAAQAASQAQPQQQQGAEAGKKDDDVVDADFTDVKK